MTTLYASSATATAQYYTRYLTKVDGEEPGRWTGHQAGLLGLSGDVTTEQLETLLEGRNPISGTQLGYPLVDRVEKSGRVRRAVAGFDATFSAPKSLSVWWALTGDERLAECHDVAVAAVVEYLERYGSTTRIRSNGGRLHPDTNGLTAAVFRQTTSRLDDPQLHTHVVISAKVCTDDGRWYALDAKTLKGFQRALGGLYQSVLRAEVTARFGVAWGDIEKGQADIAGVPTELLDVFSKRAAQVDAAYEAKLAEFWTREGRDPTPKERGALGREAAVDTRGRKTGAAAEDLRTMWQREAASVVVTADTLYAGIAEAAQTPSVEAQRVIVGDIVAELAEGRSAWHRLDVTQALCDTVRPRPGIDGRRWAALLERATDRVLDDCVDLDPTGQTRRRSDGRSVWIEPSARHHTSEAILAQEEHIISWAIDHQTTPPDPSTTVDTAGLDLMQAEAAATVAGTERLVLVVGPAGAGKTTMLRAAADDLTGHDRPVVGYAPTAKAARVLETGTGMRCDTVAKLVYEHTRPERPPRPDWDLAPGTTVVIDEAGMLATHDLYRLTLLADERHWRLALVGDPHQLQAVGRGGMFAELCATERTIELDTIHRFDNGWEAAASLKLRHGDPTGLQPYLDHDRIQPAPFAEHCVNIASYWTEAGQRNKHIAVTTTTNDHVDAINQAVQTHRHAAGQLGDGVWYGDQRLFVGDVIVTRHNQRFLHTSCGDSVRNRDYWTINTIEPTGDVTVTRIDGHGTITLPHTYVAEHVQLGYAATEPGNQSDTAAGSITLATPATTCRGFYVGVTRGQGINLVCVVTDTHVIGDAVDVLEQILASDRADQPATRTRRELAATTPPAPTLAPRCEIPDWFERLHRTARNNYAAARAERDAQQQRDRERQQRIDRLTEQLADLEHHCAPHDHAVTTASRDLHDAEQRHRRAEHELANTGLLHRRTARHAVTETSEAVATARTAFDELTRRAQPLHDQRSDLHQQRDTLRREQRRDQQFGRSLGRYHDRVGITRQQLDALNTWAAWAAGKNPSPAALINAASELQRTGGDHALLARPLAVWIDQHDLTPRRPAPPQRHLESQLRPEPPGLEIGF
ncbi:MobF family relaxase [Ilumatobacter fluminis]|uniref:MobF family relaxase n=1 Tax=Ilumatobacter fluminis TaxID=467091 RepID=UPI0032EC99B6